MEDRALGGLGDSPPAVASCRVISNEVPTSNKLGRFILVKEMFPAVRKLSMFGNDGLGEAERALSDRNAFS